MEERDIPAPRTELAQGEALRACRDNVQELLTANLKFLEGDTTALTLGDRVAVTQTIAILSSCVLLADSLEYYLGPQAEQAANALREEDDL